MKLKGVVPPIGICGSLQFCYDDEYVLLIQVLRVCLSAIAHKITAECDFRTTGLQMGSVSGRIWPGSENCVVLGSRSSPYGNNCFSH